MRNKKKQLLITALATLGVLVLILTVYQSDSGDQFECGVQEVFDIDGNSYKTVAIGRQCWMAENLRTTKYTDGEDIPRPISNESWREAGDNKAGAYACYNNLEENCSVYGALYNVYAVAEGICPEGWYVPSDGDWKVLEKELGMDKDELDLLYWRGVIATALSGEAHLWSDPSVGERSNFNASGFGAVPAGYRLSNGIYSWLGQRANFWSSTINASGWRRTIAPESSEAVRRTAAAKNIGFSVRCIKE